MEASLKLNEVNTVDDTTKVITTDNLNTNEDKSPKTEMTGFMA